MDTTTLREKILAVLAGSSSQMPVDLRKLQAATKVNLTELTSTLDALYQSRELQCCKGVKGGEAYVAFWISGMMPPAWASPRRNVVPAHKPATKLAQKKD